MGRIIKKDFSNLMSRNMKEYADEVNEERAIPSIYDGLKPSQRRILYWLSKNKGDANYLGCAEITGGVLGSFHPHGDSSVYGALVRMSQPLIMNYPLISFHGNNGSLVDPPAAMRYTKAKLGDYGKALLTDINIPGVIEWGQNYLETMDEPKYLLGTLGSLNILANPQIGIGVGLASNFTCHNIEDIKTVLKYRMEHPDCKFEDLPELYPSFHNCGVLVNKRDIPNIYKTGKGNVVLRGIYHWEDNKLIIEELPYRVDASAVKKYLIKHPVSGVDEIYEENGKLKIYVMKDANKEHIEHILLKKAGLQTSYAINMTATDLNGKPKVWSLLDILDTHIMLQHRRLIKKAEYEKSKAEHALHIDEGLIKALDIIDEVIAIIRNSDSSASAKIELMNRLTIDDEQAKAILEIKLARLARLEIDAVRQEIENFRLNIAYQNEIINSKEKREEIYSGEIGLYKDNVKHTNIFDLVSLGADGDVVDRDFYLSIQPDKIVASYEPFESSEKVSLNDSIIVITDNFRGFKKPLKTIKIGETKYEDLVLLKDNEQVIVANTETEFNKYQTFKATINGVQYNYSIGIITLGSTVRGKKLASGKDIKLSKIELEE